MALSIHSSVVALTDMFPHMELAPERASRQIKEQFHNVTMKLLEVFSD